VRATLSTAAVPWNAHVTEHLHVHSSVHLSVNVL
jgi:hypothetical protein